MSNPAFRTIEVSDPRFERDGLKNVTFKSPSLGGRADVSFFVPPGLNPAAAAPIVILLHGVYGSHWAWSMKAGAHRTAARLIEQGELPPVVLAMPSDGLWGDGSGYVAHAEEPFRNFERYIVEELPACAAAVVPGVMPASPVFIAGLSMGGFGALRLGAKFPDRFHGIAAHSAITDMSQMMEFVEEPLESYGPIPAAEQSVLHWMRTHADLLPPLRFDCGTQDSLLDANRELHAELQKLNIPHIYEEFPGGHEWPYWEKHLETTLKFFGSIAIRSHRPE